jgi:hypothetical protein
MTETGEIHEDPMIRTAELFGRNQNELADFFQNREIGVQNSQKKILITDIQPWQRANIKTPFNKLLTAHPGEFLVINFRGRSHLSFISVKDDETGQPTCLGIKNADLFEENAGYRTAKNQSEIAQYLGITPNQVRKVQYLDTTDTLYIGDAADKLSSVFLSEAEAERALRSLFES